MGMYLKQQNSRSELQEKLAKELQERARQKAAEADSPDGVDDSRYIERTQQTSRFAWVWILFFVVATGAIVWLVVSTAQ
ncbi:hypothetical protein GW746_01965 [Candidatus Saccharibacteria bacterium]|nr:hypothetical protein [Candidatus Saccharibacteria bacterium]NCS83161.1 hypothetical protein [Candidatus Saccharibacteria bacterium]